jgi:hypothetical protein
MHTSRCATLRAKKLMNSRPLGMGENVYAALNNKAISSFMSVLDLYIDLVIQRQLITGHAANAPIALGGFK